MKELVIISRPKDSPAHTHIEGRGYNGIKDAKKCIKLFRDREIGLNTAQKNFDASYIPSTKEYTIGTLEIPENWE